MIQGMRVMVIFAYDLSRFDDLCHTFKELRIFNVVYLFIYPQNVFFRGLGTGMPLHLLDVAGSKELNLVSYEIEDAQ
jgi:hypothetical protein